MSRNDQHSEDAVHSSEELRAKQWTNIEDKIMRRALALWRRKGRAHLDALSALRQAEREVLSQKQSAPPDAIHFREKKRARGRIKRPAATP